MLLFAGDGVQGWQFPLLGGFQNQNFQRKTNPNCCVASTMCSSATNVITSRPTPNPNCCVASTMCSSATNVFTKHPIPKPQLLRSINHVFKCNECYHIPSHPNPPQNFAFGHGVANPAVSINYQPQLVNAGFLKHQQYEAPNWV